MSHLLSLQTCCFMKLINEFETFPPKSLALLPLRFRYDLIQNLPAVDVCQLEQSSFIDGLDMEKVWETHCLQQKKSLPPGITTASGGNKDVYFSGVCEVLLNPQLRMQVSYRTRIFKLLFSIQCHISTEDWSGFVHDHGKFLIPNRYYSYFAKPAVDFSDAQLLVLVLQMSNYYYPKSLHCDNYFAFHYWESTENYNLLADYLKEVCNLHLSYFTDRAKSYMTFIPRILSKRLLSTLVLEGMSHDLLENTMLALRPLLIGDKGSHSQLKTFAMKHDSFLLYILSDVTASVISRVLVANQTSLHTIKLTSGSIPHHLYNCLSAFFKHPHLRLIHLSATQRLGTLQEILYAFLTTPHSSSSGEVCLHIDDFALKSAPQDMSCFIPDLSCLILPEENHCKSLVLSFIRLQFPHPLIMWLQERVVLRLKKLELSLEIADCFLNHQRMEVEEFSLVVNNYYNSTSPKALRRLEKPGCFDNVLGSKCLKRFRFSVGYSREQLTSGIVLNLVRGLQKQAEVGNLEELDLSNNLLGSTPELNDEKTQLFVAIFSLPQIEKLTLVMNLNFFSECYLARLERLWREKAGGKQLKKLSVTGPWVLVPRPTEQVLQGIMNITRELVFDKVV